MQVRAASTCRRRCRPCSRRLSGDLHGGAIRVAAGRGPSDWRHASVSWRLSAGTPAPLVAEWAAHTVEVLLRIYAHCIGDDEQWFGPMENALGRADLARWPRSRSAYVPGTATESRIWRDLAAHDQTGRSDIRAGQRPYGLVSMGAPSRIRTCAHGSGGRCCTQLLPGNTCHVGLAWGRIGGGGDQDGPGSTRRRRRQAASTAEAWAVCGVSERHPAWNAG
jgi:hypothetical protein